MAIKRTKYCALKTCKKPIVYGTHCNFECAQKDGKAFIIHKPIKSQPTVFRFYTNPLVKKRKAIKKKFYAPGQAKPKKIRPLSKKRAQQNKLYLELRAAFLVNKICPITGEMATEVHHKKGRCGALLTDVRFFLAVSRRGHVWIEANPAEAEKLGYVIKRTTKTE